MTRLRRFSERLPQCSVPFFMLQACVAAMCCASTSLFADDDVNRIDVQQKSATVVPVSQVGTDQVPVVIAHRGASGYLPEHTTEAAAYAHALGADFIEQDVVLTKDGVAVVLHDVTLDAVTDVATVYPDRKRDGHYYVFDFEFAELQKLNVIERYATEERKRFPRGSGRFRISSLNQHLQLIQGLNRSGHHKAGVYVEIKKPTLHRRHGLDPSRVVLRTLQQFGYQENSDRVFVQCFEKAEVLRMRTELKCQLPLIQLLSGMPTDEQIEEYGNVADGLGVRMSTVIRGANDDRPDLTGLVSKAHEQAMVVHVWTHRDDELPRFVDSSFQLLTWLAHDARVDGVFTDHPDIVLSWRRTQNSVKAGKGPFQLLKDESPLSTP